MIKKDIKVIIQGKEVQVQADIYYINNAKFGIYRSGKEYYCIDMIRRKRFNFSARTKKEIYKYIESIYCKKTK